MNMADTVAPKSDQMNADDLIAGPRTITITEVKQNPGGGKEQPVNVFFEGDGGKPFRPCLSMRRVMIAAWGIDATQYVGRSMRLYRDPDVLWGGMKVGGIRISHMSHIDRDLTMALTETKKTRKPYTVKVLAAEKPAAPPEKPTALAAPLTDEAMNYARDLAARIRSVKTLAELEAITAEPDVIEKRAMLSAGRPKLAERITAAVREMLDGFDEGAPA